MTVIAGDALSFVDLPGRASADPLAGLAAAASIRIVRPRRTPDRRAHMHPRSEEIMYVAAGSGQVWIDGARHRVTAGDIVHIARGAAHATVPDHDGAMLLVCFFPDPDLASNMVEAAAIVAGHTPADAGDGRDTDPDRTPPTQEPM